MKMKVFLALMFAARLAWSFTVSGVTYTTDGSQADVQAACSAAPDDGTVTVLIPNGTYRWTGNVTVRRALTLAGASRDGVILQNANASSSMLAVVSSAKGNVNIYWLNVLQVVNNGGSSGTGQLACDRVEPSPYTVLVHDCTFDTAAYFSYAVWAWANGIIFWNDNFPATGAGPTCLTGISFTANKYGQTSSWNTPSTFGNADATGLMNSYVEDCSFTNGSSFACDFNDNARVVWRYNNMQDSMIGNHGQETSPYGARHYEIYNNTFKLTNNNPKNMNNWVVFRGGSAVFFNNVVPAIPQKTPIVLTILSINRRVAIPCQTAYPAARQTGQGWSESSQAPSGNPVVTANGLGSATEGVYIWDNTGSGATGVGLSQFTPDECGNGQKIGDYLKEGRDYFVGRAKPGYTPFQYPHPLHTQYALGGGGQPTPTPAPTPAPTATPAPSATPQPTPPPTGASYEQWIQKQNDWIRANPPTPDR